MQGLRIKILEQFYGELRINPGLETRTHWMTDNLSSEISKKTIIFMLITAFHAQALAGMARVESKETNLSSQIEAAYEF